MTDHEKTDGRVTPPETDEDHNYLWSGASHSHRMWPVMKPIVALVENWKALAVVLAVLAFLFSERFALIIQQIGGVL